MFAECPPKSDSAYAITVSSSVAQGLVPIPTGQTNRRAPVVYVFFFFLIKLAWRTLTPEVEPDA